MEVKIDEIIFSKLYIKDIWYSSCTIYINFSNHVHEFLLCGILSHRSHDLSQFFRADRSVAIFVKHQKRFFDIYSKKNENIGSNGGSSISLSLIADERFPLNVVSCVL